MAKPNPVRRAETRRKLLEVARAEFATHGYGDGGTEPIVVASGLTRGALYYHFKDKRDLFRAVVADMAIEIANAMATAATSKPTPWEGLLAGSRAFLDVAARPDILRIYLQDAPAALGWSEWRAVDGEGVFGFLLRTLVLALHDAAKAKEGTAPALARLIAGALTEAALFIASASDAKKARGEIERTLLALLLGIRDQYAPTE
jgi:AcrR family transcriptional regulator